MNLPVDYTILVLFCATVFAVFTVNCEIPEPSCSSWRRRDISLDGYYIETERVLQIL